MSHAIPDKELVAQVVRGRTDAFGQLVERHIHGAYAVAYARVGNATDAEDAVQEAFLRALEKLRSLRDPARFGSWLLSIARNEAVRLSTERKRTAANAPAAVTAIVPDAGSREMNALVREQVMRLPEQHREILLLHYFTGRSTKEIAELLDLRQGAVLKRLQRAREQLAVSILRDLEGTRPSDASFSKQVARIAALASAAGAGSATVSAAAAATVGAGALTWKVLTAAIVAVAAIGVVAAVRAMNPTEEPPLAPATAAVVVEEAPNNDEPVVSVIPEVEPDPAPIVLAQNDTSGESAAPAHETSDGILDLDGSWTVTGSFPETSETGSMLVELKRNGSTIQASGKLGTEDIVGDGRLIGSILQLKIYLAEGHPAIGRQHLTLEGTLDAQGIVVSGALDIGPGNAFALKGTYTTCEYAGTIGNERFVPESRPISTTWKRVSGTDLDFTVFLMQKTQELERLGKAISDYYAANSKTLPPNLQSLVPQFIDSVDAFTEPSVRIVHHNLKNPEALPSFNIGAVFRGEYAPELAMPDRLFAFESDLQELWDASFLQKPIVTVQYEQHPLLFYVTRDGVRATLFWGTLRLQNDVGAGGQLRVRPQSSTPTIGSDPAHRTFLEEKRAACANNLKQLCLVIKMFMNECPGEYSPPGWMSVYPEYMPDRNLLVCPNSQPGTISYRMIWPTASETELRQLYSDRFGGAAGPTPDSNIPLIVEIDECSHSGGRHVVYLDGHAEYIKGPLENQPKLAPFLNLK